MNIDRNDNKGDIRRGITQTAQVLLLLMALLAVHIVYLQIFAADELATHPLNRRHGQIVAGVMRGSIFAADGAVLAYSDDTGRHRPLNESAAFVTGYASEKLGSTGIENFANYALSGENSIAEKFGPVGKLFRSPQGADVWLTVDSRLQRAAHTALSGKRGAAVVLDAATGAVLVMVSEPAFDPNTVDLDWDSLNADENRPLLNRVTMGMYPPGSTIKPVIADAALAEGITSDNEVFICEGKLDVGGGYYISESHEAVHGRVKLADAVAESCNVAFGTLAERLGEKRLRSVFERFGFDQTGADELNWNAAHLPPTASPLDDGDVAQLGIGQSYLLTSPMTMALTAAAFFNGGEVMRPYIIDRITDANGDDVLKTKPQVYFTATTVERAEKIKNYLQGVVDRGTGRGAQLRGATIAGKTGTAENPNGEDHAWFIGGATVGKKRVAFAVIVENGGSGAEAAVPVARDIVAAMRDNG